MEILLHLIGKNFVLVNKNFKINQHSKYFIWVSIMILLLKIVNHVIQLVKPVQLLTVS